MTEKRSKRYYKTSYTPLTTITISDREEIFRKKSKITSKRHIHEQYQYKPDFSWCYGCCSGRLKHRYCDNMSSWCYSIAIFMIALSLSTNIAMFLWGIIILEDNKIGGVALIMSAIILTLCDVVGFIWVEYKRMSCYYYACQCTCKQCKIHMINEYDKAFNGKNKFYKYQWEQLDRDDRFDYIMGYWLRKYCDAGYMGINDGMICYDIEELIYDFI